jgi:hypothetical protein
LTIPYLNRLWRELEVTRILGIPQDSERPTRELIDQAHIEFPVALDVNLSVSRLYNPVAVPTLFLIGGDGRIAQTLSGFDKRVLNEIATAIRLESLGVPAVPVATREFMTAARAQASALGRSDLDAVYVAHPIQDQTSEEIEARAEAALEEIASRLID